MTDVLVRLSSRSAKAPQQDMPAKPVRIKLATKRSQLSARRPGFLFETVLVRPSPCSPSRLIEARSTGRIMRRASSSSSNASGWQPLFINPGDSVCVGVREFISRAGDSDNRPHDSAGDWRPPGVSKYPDWPTSTTISTANLAY